MRFRTITDKNYEQTYKELGLDPLDAFGMFGWRIGQGFIIEMGTYQRKADALIEERRVKLQADLDARYDGAGFLGMTKRPPGSMEEMFDLISEARRFYRPIKTTAPTVAMVNSREYSVGPFPTKRLTGNDDVTVDKTTSIAYSAIKKIGEM